MVDKEKRNNIKKKIAAGGGVGLGIGLTRETLKEKSTTKSLSRVKNSIGLEALKKKMKVGDIILESDPKRIYTSKLRFDEVVPLKGRISDKLGSKTVPLTFSDAIASSGGGNSSHLSIYIGDGEIIDFPVGKKSKMQFQSGKRLYVKRFAVNSAQGKKIAASAKAIGKTKFYKGAGNILGDFVRRNLFDAPRGTVKKIIDCGETTCSSFAAEAVEKGIGKKAIKGVRHGLADPTDILRSKRGKFVGKLNSGIKTTGREKFFGKLGKGVRSGKMALIGAGLVAGFLIGKAAYDYFTKTGKGKWITVKGRRVLIKD